jgi:hypothetical protein
MFSKTHPRGHSEKKLDSLQSMHKNEKNEKTTSLAMVISEPKI